MCDIVVKNADMSMFEDIVVLDEGVIGSRDREVLILDAIEKGQCYVVCQDHIIAAFGIMNYSFYEMGFINLLIVGQSYRRKGYSSLLIQNFVKLCRTEKLFTSTNSTNIAMQKLLDNCGFTRCGLINELDEGDPEIVYLYKKNKKYFQIIPMTIENVFEIEKLNQPFKIIGRILPVFLEGKWTWTEERFDTCHEKVYPLCEIDLCEYKNNREKVIFLAYLGNKCVGQIRLRRNWNKYCYIEDISVDGEHRRTGYGKELIKMAVKWAAENEMSGIMLETQNNNLIACRFYQSCGFVLGGVDNMLYRSFSNNKELALFWYLNFKS